MNRNKAYRLSTDVEPFMKTQRKANGYTTSYAQVQIHHGTHVDFPPHVGLDGDPDWRLSGRGRILCPKEFEPSLLERTDIFLFRTGGEDLPTDIVDATVAADSITLIGTDSERVGDLDTHKRLLDESIPLVENLVNLDEPASKEGHVDCYPLLIEGCDDGALTTIVFFPKE